MYLTTRQKTLWQQLLKFDPTQGPKPTVPTTPQSDLNLAEAK